MLHRVSSHLFEFNLKNGLFPQLSPVNLSSFNSYDGKKASLIRSLEADLACMRQSASQAEEKYIKATEIVNRFMMFCSPNTSPAEQETVIMSGNCSIM
jgi:hypothetical protein